MILTGILRHYLSSLLASSPKKPVLLKVREQRSLARAQNLRINHAQVSRTAFQKRKEDFGDGVRDQRFVADPDAKNKPKGNPMSDPAMMEGMMGMMKGNVAMMVPQSLIMGWINAFFSGYVISESTLLYSLDICGRVCILTPVAIVKLPFPLTPQFKSMLQSGVGTRDLDVRWVSSLSWYFLTLFGLQPVYNFILGSNNAASQMTQQMQMAQGGQQQMNPMGGQEDPEKPFKMEVENLEVVEHWCVLEGIEERLLKKLGPVV